MSGHSSEGAEPNLTPILDLVFQLITFFMLVINFKGASMDLSLKLPVLGSARPLKWTGKLEPLMLNINSEGKINVYGQSIDVEKHVAKEQRLVKLQLEAAGQKLTNNELPVVVIIRADKSVPFKLLNHVIETCQKHGFVQYQLSAMTREER